MSTNNLPQPGDVLVQSQGFPWIQLAWLSTGAPFPHSVMVSRVEPIYGDARNIYRQAHFIYVLENGPSGVVEHAIDNANQYECWRPRCAPEVKEAAINWARGHVGEGYGYGRLLEIFFGYRSGLSVRPGMDDDLSQDGRKKVCSELIAMAYYRSGFDLVPGVSDRDTLPKDLRNWRTLEYQNTPYTAPFSDFGRLLNMS